MRNRPLLARVFFFFFLFLFSFKDASSNYQQISTPLFLITISLINFWIQSLELAFDLSRAPVQISLYSTHTHYPRIRYKAHAMYRHLFIFLLSPKSVVILDACLHRLSR